MPFSLLLRKVARALKIRPKFENQDPLMPRLFPFLEQRNLFRGGLLWLLIVVYTPVFCYLFWGSLYWASWTNMLGISLIMFVFNAMDAFFLQWLAQQIGVYFPHPHQSALRLSSMISLFVGINFFLGQQLMYALGATQWFGYSYKPAQAPWVLAAMTCMNILLAGISEGVYAFTQWRIHQEELEALEHQQLQMQLEEVKQQVNPHFLFNSLNSLSVLIADNPRQAERFVDEMATVYRYLLQAGQMSMPGGGLVTLEAELRFLQAYSYLLDTRYGSAISLEVNVCEAARTQYLPVLTLQTLVDNAIKHNVVLAQQPLSIQIRANSPTLLRVSNSLQKRSVTIPLNRAGLSMLMARYRLLQGESVQVLVEDQRYIVELPLLQAV
ncbi:hypothetical protein BWI97_18650 [Siphonobacter sp. BAB-5405]|nr:hypothetical protein BWI97_18650 [Siphonobacter sp. BAB-5405]